MKTLLFALILSAATFSFAEEPVIEPAATGNSSDVVGTIQEPTHQNEKKIKKIMAHKEKSAAKKHHGKKNHHGKKHHGKHSPAKTEAAPETK